MIFVHNISIVFTRNILLLEILRSLTHHKRLCDAQHDVLWGLWW